MKRNEIAPFAAQDVIVKTEKKEYHGAVHQITIEDVLILVDVAEKFGMWKTEVHQMPIDSIVSIEAKGNDKS